MNNDHSPSEKNEGRVVELTAQFVRELVSLRGKTLRGKSMLGSDLGAKLEAPAGLSPGPFFVRARDFQENRERRAVLDLGCGNGPHRTLIEKAGCSWVGCDWDGSEDPTAKARAGTALDGEVVKYGGKELPFESASFDIVWSWQSLEHVQDPELTVSEIARVLRHDGVFAGAVSFLEPYHARSTYGYSPWGFQLLCARNGMSLLVAHPAKDALMMLVIKLAIMLEIVDDGSSLLQAFRRSEDIMSPLREAFEQSGKADVLGSVFGQICATFGFIARKQ